MLSFLLSFLSLTFPFLPFLFLAPLETFVHDLHSDVCTLKDDVNIFLDKASLESQESIGFIKATKILLEKNSTDIMKIKEFFQKYGYTPCAKKNSVGEQEVIDSKPESNE